MTTSYFFLLGARRFFPNLFGVGAGRGGRGAPRARASDDPRGAGVE